MLNGGISIFKQEIRNGYELFYIGNKFSISWRFSNVVSLIQVYIISRESSLFDELEIPLFNAVGNHDLSGDFYQINYGATLLNKHCYWYFGYNTTCIISGVYIYKPH